jgi:hypothetical protein
VLAVVVADVEVDGEYRFERRKVAPSPTQLRSLADWFTEREVEEVVMESTAQYWRPAGRERAAALAGPWAGPNARGCVP